MQIKFLSFIAIAAVAAASVATVQADKFLTDKPAYLIPCHLKDANFKTCYTKNFQPLFREWKDGVPGLKTVGKLDPLSVKRIKLEQDSGNTLNLNIDMQNIIIDGISTGVVKDTDLDTDQWFFNMQVFLPKITFNSDFKVKGTVLALNLNGNGKSFFESENVLMAFHVPLKLRDEGDFTFTEIKSIDVNIKEIGGFRLHLDNLFGGQKELEDSANQLFNENWRELFEIMRPALQKTVATVLFDRFSKVFHFVPANYFIDDIPKAKDIYG